MSGRADTRPDRSFHSTAPCIRVTDLKARPGACPSDGREAWRTDGVKEFSRFISTGNLPGAPGA